MSRTAKRWLGALALVALVPPALVSLRVATRPRPVVASAPEATPWTRESCIECHAPIAEEWRGSFHFRSVTGPWWGRIRRKNADDVFDLLRVPCMGCHAPADALGAPAGAPPAERRSDRELGVDCVSCHVTERGIVGPGRFVAAPHPVIPDDRFRDPALTSEALCAACHEEPGGLAPVVSDWRASRFASEGITCLDCHMSEVEAPIVSGGPPRRRRSHAFPGDKDLAMLQRAVNASLTISPDRRAVLRLVNDRVGHALPAAGTNSLRVEIRVADADRRTVRVVEQSFGTIEMIPGYLDFWPFRVVTKIPAGETREVAAPLPPGPGTVTAEVRYRDWFAVTDRDRVVESLALAFGAAGP